MVRARLAMLSLAGGLLLATSGCLNVWDRFHCWRQNSGYQTSADCTCADTGLPYGATPTALETGGPVLVTPVPSPPPGPQTAPPPRVYPQPAPPSPWTGQ